MGEKLQNKAQHWSVKQERRAGHRRAKSHITQTDVTPKTQKEIQGI